MSAAKANATANRADSDCLKRRTCGASAIESRE